MFEDPSVKGGRMLDRIAVAMLASLVCVFAAVSPKTVGAQQTAPVPDFTIDSESAWLMVGDDFLPPASGPGPVTFDKRYPYVDNRAAWRSRTQPTYRVADLTNPIMKPWVVEEMRKANDWVLAGKVPFRARGKMIEVRIAVEDPGAFTTPWSAMQRFRRVSREWSEDICAENNFDFLQYDVVPLPQAAKADF
jgi:hypothetical protein